MTQETIHDIIERLASIEAHAKGAHDHAKRTNGRIFRLEKNQTKIIAALIFVLGVVIGLASRDINGVLQFFI